MLAKELDILLSQVPSFVDTLRTLRRSTRKLLVFVFDLRMESP